MRAASITLTLVTLLAPAVAAQEPARLSGRLVLADGTVVPFEDMIYNYNAAVCSGNARLCQVGTSSFVVDYQGSRRELPFTALKEVRLDSYEMCKADNCPRDPHGGVAWGDFRVTTRTGVNLTARLHGASHFKVRMRDDLTGEVRQILYPFIVFVNGVPQLNVRAVIFDG
ncbi:MAG: hypothetical protein ACRENB_09345 [Gemmatimonadales bacterium]